MRLSLPKALESYVLMATMHIIQELMAPRIKGKRKGNAAPVVKFIHCHIQQNRTAIIQFLGYGICECHFNIVTIMRCKVNHSNFSTKMS